MWPTLQEPLNIVSCSVVLPVVGSNDHRASPRLAAPPAGPLTISSWSLGWAKLDTPARSCTSLAHHQHTPLHRFCSCSTHTHKPFDRRDSPAHAIAVTLRICLAIAVPCSRSHLPVFRPSALVRSLREAPWNLLPRDFRGPTHPYLATPV